MATGNDVFKPGKQFATHTGDCSAHIICGSIMFAVTICEIVSIPEVYSLYFFSSNARANQIKPQKVATKT